MAKRSPVKPHDPQRAVCVIGAGLGGLALAIRLQAAGLPTTLIEARGEVGGLLRRVPGQDFLFEEGPSLLADPAPLRELWSISGEDSEAALKLLPVDVPCRFLWSDGTAFDAAGDPAELLRQIKRLAPAELARLEDWQGWTAMLRTEAWPRLSDAGAERGPGLVQLLSTVQTSGVWRSAGGQVARLFDAPHLRAALAHPALFSGANPFSASALVLGGQALAGAGPGYWPQGGMTGLAQALAKRFTDLGGSLRLHDPALRIHCLGSRASEVETSSGWRAHFAAVASAADAVHTYRTLLKDTARGPVMARKLSQRRFAPSALSVHFALAGSWPGIAHQTVLVGPRFAALLDDIFDHGVLPRDMLIWLHHPTLTDPELAPEGHSLMRATVPVAHLGKLPLDWDSVAPMLAERVIAEVGRRLIPDIRDRILAQCITSPRDLALDLGLHLGSGWSLEQCAAQTGPLRLPHRDRKIANLYFAGAATHPGAGVAGVLAGAKAAAKAIVGDIT